MGSIATGLARWEKTDPPSESGSAAFLPPAGMPQKPQTSPAGPKKWRIAASANWAPTEKLEAVARLQPKTPVKVDDDPAYQSISMPEKAPNPGAFTGEENGNREYCQLVSKAFSIRPVRRTPFEIRYSP
jgi:hypothetical protein